MAGAYQADTINTINERTNDMGLYVSIKARLPEQADKQHQGTIICDLGRASSLNAWIHRHYAKPGDSIERFEVELTPDVFDHIAVRLPFFDAEEHEEQRIHNELEPDAWPLATDYRAEFAYERQRGQRMFGAVEAAHALGFRVFYSAT